MGGQLAKRIILMSDRLIGEGLYRISQGLLNSIIWPNICRE